MPLTPGTCLAHYEIISRIGAGGMGEVYSARDLHLDRKVAIKILVEHLSENDDALRRFEKEAKAVASLSHPNILEIHDYGSENAVFYAVTELLEGETLRSQVSQSPLSWRKAVEIAVAVAEGLAAAHSKGVIHRDLKPENIFLTTDGRVKILDFGLARLKPQVAEDGLTEVATVSKLTQTGIILGTVPYMSPEQVRGDVADERSDIFALGCVLYEMIAARRPFQGTTSSEVTASILRDEPLSLSEVPPELNRILHHCLEKNPEKRIQSARDLAMELRDLLGSTEISRVAAPRRLRTYAALFAVFILIAAIGIFYLRQKPSVVPFKKFESLAVLPLANLSGDPQQEYFADGMTEELITDLAKIKSLKVISRTSVIGFKNTKKPIREIADQLRVDAVIEGSVIRSANRARITAQLIDATTDTHLWAESYERDLRDVLAMQSEVAQAIATQIKATLTSEEHARIAAARTVDPEAYELYLRGRYEWEKRTRESLETAAKYFQQAIDKDPTFALAYVGLGDTYAILCDNLFWTPDEGWPKAKAAQLKALEIDENLGEAHVSLAGTLEIYYYDFAGAENEYGRGLELSPGYATGHHWYALYLSLMGRTDEALTEIWKAAQLDPLSPRIRANVGGFVLYNARRYDQAIQELKRALELHPDDAATHEYLGDNFLHKAMYENALEQYKIASKLWPNEPKALLPIARVYALSGNRAEALKILEQVNQLKKKVYAEPYFLATSYIALGDKKRALDYLEQAYKTHSGWIERIKVSPDVDPLRSEPRFQDLLRRMKFPD